MYEQILKLVKQQERIIKMREAREIRKQKLIAKNYYVENHNETIIKDGQIKLRKSKI